MLALTANILTAASNRANIHNKTVVHTILFVWTVYAKGLVINSLITKMTFVKQQIAPNELIKPNYANIIFI